MQRSEFILIVAVLITASCTTSVVGFLEQIAARLPLPGTPSPPGSPWPLPRAWTRNLNVATLSSKDNFQYISNVNDCRELNVALGRYDYEILTQKSGRVDAASGFPILSKVYIHIPENARQNLCGEFPKLNRSLAYESYKIVVGNSSEGVPIANISAETIWGALRGLETFSQLVWRDRDWSANHYYINFTEINDSPRYPHRGLMLDTARHYLAPRVIKQVLDAMSYNKLNVFHWHIIDDQSFPFVSRTFPELSDKGAYIPGVLIYDPPTVQDIIEEARLRGIRVVFEFDTPGHTLVFKKSHPELLTPCYGDGVNPGTPDYPNHAAHEILDPTKENTYTFMKDLFTEVFHNVTKDEYLHLGMDEVYYACWKSSPEIKSFMEKNNYTEVNQVQEHYTKRHLSMVQSLGAKAIIWQDPLDYGVQLDKDVIVQIWKSGTGETSWQTYFQKALDAGYSTLLSSCWYLNYIAYGETWRQYYECDPELSLPKPLPDWQKELILGGEAALWAEYVDATNVVSRLFPYLGAVAEKLWSTANSSSTDDAMWRLDEQRCRMLGRGINAQPIFNGYCFPGEIF
ncbi:unnamed protein product [Allacma fusca]|uniref:Beta-hexosaminidase n=1 Tax=Allacma fusca TaxID=39272 RepID=A0A8J2K0S5_9HEXA|nr:unnamed protein product [Allacma fusca]